MNIILISKTYYITGKKTAAVFDVKTYFIILYIELKYENKECMNHASSNIQVLWISFLKRN